VSSSPAAPQNNLGGDAALRRPVGATPRPCHLLHVDLALN
jgi:hypothetical protein